MYYINLWIKYVSCCCCCCLILMTINNFSLNVFMFPLHGSKLRTDISWSLENGKHIKNKKMLKRNLSCQAAIQLDHIQSQSGTTGGRPTKNQKVKPPASLVIIFFLGWATIYYQDFDSRHYIYLGVILDFCLNDCYKSIRSLIPNEIELSIQELVNCKL